MASLFVSPVRTQPLQNLADFSALAGITLAVNKDDKQMVCAFIQSTSVSVCVCLEKIRETGLAAFTPAALG